VLKRPKQHKYLQKVLKLVKRRVQPDFDQLLEGISRLLKESSFSSKLSTLKNRFIQDINSTSDGHSRTDKPSSFKTHRILIPDNYADEEAEPVLSDVPSILKEYFFVMAAIIIETGANELDDRVLEEVVDILVRVIASMENEALEQSK
jgi:hypothetical protein